MSVDPLQELVIRKMRDLDNWLEKYEYLIGLGDCLPAMEPALRTEERAINGCQSRVWIHAEIANGRIRFRGDCDARITRGVLALILSIVDDQSPADIAEMDLYCLYETGLMANLSPSRVGGVAAIVHRVRDLAISFRD